MSTNGHHVLFRLPMDAMALLQRDHIRALVLVRQIEALTPDPASRSAHLLQLSRELAVHAAVEEKALYAVLRDGVQTRDIVAEAAKHHQRIHELLFDLAVKPPDAADWSASFAQLAAVVSGYVEHEETRVLTAARETIAPARMRGVMRELLGEQRRLLRAVRPSPHW
jgi:hypothetical protein